MTSLNFDPIREHGDGPAIKITSAMGPFDRWKHCPHESRIVDGVLYDEEGGLHCRSPDLRRGRPAPFCHVRLEPRGICGIGSLHRLRLRRVDDASDAEAFADGLVSPSPCLQLLARFGQDGGRR